MTSHPDTTPPELPHHSWEPIVYAAFFPAGIEDVVLDALLRLAAAHELRIQRYTYPDAAALRGGSSSPPSVPPATTDTTTPKGLLLFSVHRDHDADDGAVAHERETRLCTFLAAACCLRVVERLSLYLWCIPIAGRTKEETLADLRGVITGEAAHTQHTVLHVLGAVRAMWGHLRAAATPEKSTLPAASQVWGPHYFQPLHNDDVAFRVNCERRVTEELIGSLKSVDLAAAAGDTLWGLHSAHNWEVSMLYHNVEFFLLQDDNAWLTAAVTLSPPPPPRCGFDIDVTFQYAAELLRQHICGALRRKEVDLTAVKGLVPRVSLDRQEIRASKGACAMRSSLACALCTYAGVSEVAGASPCPVLMHDPFCGSGTTLLEAWVQVVDRIPSGAVGVCGAVLGSELESADVRRTLRNTRGDYLAWLAALYGYGAHTRHGTRTSAWVSVERDVAAWRGAVEKRVANVVQGGSYLTCGADGLRALLCDGICGPLDAPVSSPSSGPSSPAIAAPRAGCGFSVLRCNAMRVPLRAGVVECIVSDMPFGVRCGSHRANARLYPRFLRECHRLLRSPSKAEPQAGNTADGVAWWHRAVDATDIEASNSGGGRAVLLTLELRLMSEALEALRTECPFRIVRQPFPVDMGGLYPYVFVLDKLA